jgi:hypothetical protein
MKFKRNGSRAWRSLAAGTDRLVQGRRRRVAKRDRYSRWKRLPPVFRSGQHKIPGPGDELQRIIVYLKGDILDQAEAQAERAGVPTVQEYCAELLARAIEIERVKQHVAEVEARRGPLEGLSEISEDHDYLTEWQRKFDSGEIRVLKQPPAIDAGNDGNSDLTVPIETLESVMLPEVPDSLLEGADGPDGTALNSPLATVEPEKPDDRPTVRIEPARDRIEPTIRAPERIVPEVLDRTAIETVFLHVGPGDQDPGAFLASLRKGQAVDPQKVAELMQALGRIEADHRGATMVDRRLSYALYRLALESQVLITEAWPGVFDDRMIGAVRAVQEMVERILSGEDIRYYQADEGVRWEDDQ